MTMLHKMQQLSINVDLLFIFHFMSVIYPSNKWSIYSVICSYYLSLCDLIRYQANVMFNVLYLWSAVCDRCKCILWHFVWIISFRIKKFEFSSSQLCSFNILNLKKKPIWESHFNCFQTIPGKTEIYWKIPASRHFSLCMCSAYININNFQFHS